MPREEEWCPRSVDQALQMSNSERWRSNLSMGDNKGWGVVGSDLVGGEGWFGCLW